MKKAPKRYQDGGGIKKPLTAAQLAAEVEAKRVAKETGIEVPNPNFPTVDEQMYQKGHLNKSELQRRQSEARLLKGSGSTTATGVQKYGLLDPRLEYNRPKKAKGGEIKKMTKAPKRGKR